MVRDARYVIWLLMLGAVVLLNLPLPVSMRIESGTRDQFAPFQNFMTLARHRLKTGFSTLHHAQRLRRERREWLEEMAELRERVRRLERFELENQVLRRQLGFAVLSPHRLLLCEVIARGDMSGWWRTIRINKGAIDGVREGQAVTSVDGLVGRTHNVAARTAEVLLMTDPNCRIAAVCERTGAYGIVRGAGIRMSRNMPLEMLAAALPGEMDFVPRAQPLRTGDTIVTSGLGGLFPEGLEVGRVTAVTVDESGLYQRATIQPAATLGSLKLVFVVLDGE